MEEERQVDNRLEDEPLAFRALIPLAWDFAGVRGGTYVEEGAYEKRVAKLLWSAHLFNR